MTDNNKAKEYRKGRVEKILADKSFRCSLIVHLIPCSVFESGLEFSVKEIEEKLE